MVPAFDHPSHDPTVAARSEELDDRLAAMARLAAAATGAPLGVVCISEPQAAHISGPAGPVPVGPSSGSFAWSLLASRLVEHSAAETVIPDLLDHAVAAGLSEGDLGGVTSFEGAPVRDDRGGVVGVVGVLETTVRGWSPANRTVLDDLANLVAASLRTQHSAPSWSPPGRLGQTIADSLTAAASGLEGLVEHAGALDDPGLQRRAGVAERHLRALRSQGARIRSELSAEGPPTAVLFDLCAVVRDVLRTLSADTYAYGLRSQLPEAALSVLGDPVAVGEALEQLLTTALAVAPAEAITVQLVSRAVSTDSLSGSLTADLHIAISGVALGAADLSRAVSGILRTDQDAPGQVPPVTIRVSGADVKISGRGLRARSGDQGTQIAVRWPVDLG
ncbi:hypothetical protein N865_17485 [Intrasporangium oryzae NRRL B-24470]|uniref:GAF domain-containing protein n=1 Tax=Intrasporangium oryzae NRRL B-24470 TaxID=1386089 RepID=W9GE92_9MICO|nr:hypothetical protein [Intrasporangium oryzae]EWT03527.1 hypothetical protein N865_17485 [Intrasporangium oryzae NRRL B-24470]